MAGSARSSAAISAAAGPCHRDCPSAIGNHTAGSGPVAGTARPGSVQPGPRRMDAAISARLSNELGLLQHQRREWPCGRR